MPQRSLPSSPITVYLIHFERPYVAKSGAFKKYSQHYLGSAKVLSQRIHQHQHGYGARLMAIVKEEDIPWRVVRVWKGTRETEKALKRLRHPARLCPICRERQRQYLFNDKRLRKSLERLNGR